MKSVHNNGARAIGVREGGMLMCFVWSCDVL